MKLKFFKRNNKHTGKREWVAQWFVSNQSTPVTQSVSHNFWWVFRRIFSGWVYAFKYPTTVSKTFWQVFKSKVLA
ncbi:MAG TPA: hypothetical protein VD794_16030 [Flavisolibacter sp.]|nr:hypothetical protein [Flavisolibacter sp.]